MKYCEKCNKFYSEDKCYCSECGNVLIDKDKPENNSEIGYDNIGKIVEPAYEIFFKRYLLLLVIGISIAELLLTWLMLVDGVPKVMDGSWGHIIFYIVICAGLTKAREWLTKKYAGNTEMKTFGISRTTISDLEKSLSWIYPIVEILCGIVCLRYAGEMFEFLADFSDWSSFQFGKGLLLVCFRWAYKVKEWVMLPRGLELLWNISTVHREFDENIKIWGNVKTRIFDCLPKKWRK